MTAFLPVPQDDSPDQPDERVESAPDGRAHILKLPRKPREPRKPNISAAEAAEAAALAPATPDSAVSALTDAPPDPGPPPPLPPDLDVEAIVIPPKPPLPDPVAAPVEAASAPQIADEEVEASVDEEEVIVGVPAEDGNTGPHREVSVEDVAESAIAVDVAASEVDAHDVDLGELDVLTVADTPVTTAALSLRGIRKSFGETRAVDGIDLTVPAGTFYGLVGPNGAGKTTTLSMIAGLLRPDRGSIVVGGVDAAAHPRQAKRLMGVLPDRLRTFDRLTGRQLLYYYGVLRGLKPAVVESRTADLARAFDLTDALGRVVSDYSAGMAKKVMLAGAMIHSPRLLVLDEPFEAVDPVSSAIILDILSTYVAHGGTVILSSHGMELVERVCSRVAVLVAGQVLAEGTVEEVRGELTLEQRFIELAGGLSDVEGLEWLHTFSD